jgi:hypothetical protein
MLYSPGDANALASCILQMQGDTTMRDKMIEEGAKRYEQEFTAAISIQRMRQIVDRLITT